MAQTESPRMQASVTHRAIRTFPTLDHVWVWAALALIALRPLLTPIPPHDFWWHMATGRLIIHTGQIPLMDQFSYTQAGQPFYNQGWLAQVGLYAIHSLGGIHLIIVVQALVVTLSYGLLLRLCIRRSGALRLSVGLLLLTTMPLSFDNWNVRPQTYAFPLFVGFLYILTAWRLGFAATGGSTNKNKPLFSRRVLVQGHRLWLLPVLMMIWVNVHGSFVLGGGLITLIFAGEWLRRFWQDRRLAAAASQASASALDPGAGSERPALFALFFWGGVTAVAMLVNPRGIAVLAYVRDLLRTSAVTQLVTEWAPPTTRDLAGTIFFLFLMFCIVVLVYARRRPDPLDMLLAGAFLWLALGAERNVVWFGMVMTPLLAVQMATWRSAPANHPRFVGVPRINAILIGFLTFLLLLGLPWIKPILELPPELGSLVAPDTPVAATEFMLNEPQQPERLFHSMGFGSYLIWAAPDQPVFIDPRIELYPYTQWREYIQLSAGNSVAELLAQYQFDAMLLDNENQAGLVAYLQTQPDWQMRFEDAQSSYLVKLKTQ